MNHRPIPLLLLMALATSTLLATILAACVALPPPASQAEPTEDRVGFPENYQSTYTIFYEFDRPDNKTARVIYANPQAASVQNGKPFAYGSILVMEVYRTKKDEAGNVLLDEKGRFQRDELTGIFVSRKEPGFGGKYKELRNGEWEYVAYRADKSVLTPPERTNGCAGCHVEAGLGKDWVFGAHRYFAATEVDASTSTTNVITLNDYTFAPQVITVPVGSDVVWNNHDIVFHTVTATDLAYSAMVRPTGAFRHKFDSVGEYNYVCAVHTSMKGKIVVVEP